MCFVVSLCVCPKGLVNLSNKSAVMAWASLDYEEVVFTLGVVPCGGKGANANWLGSNRRCFQQQQQQNIPFGQSQALIIFFFFFKSTCPFPAFRDTFWISCWIFTVPKHTLTLSLPSVHHTISLVHWQSVFYLLIGCCTSSCFRNSHAANIKAALLLSSTFSWNCSWNEIAQTKMHSCSNERVNFSWISQNILSTLQLGSEPLTLKEFSKGCKRERSVPGSTPVSPSQELSLIKSIVPACSGRPSKSSPLSALHQFAVWTPVSVSVLPGTEFLSC